MSVVFDTVPVRTKFVFNCSKDEPAYDRKYKKRFWTSRFLSSYLHKISSPGVGLKFKNGKTVYDHVAFCNLLFFLANLCCREREWKEFSVQDGRKLGWRKRQWFWRQRSKAGKPRQREQRVYLSVLFYIPSKCSPLDSLRCPANVVICS